MDKAAESSGAGAARTAPTVFLSYRRDDVPDATDRLAISLVERLGRDHVFVDVDSIDIGAPFATVIKDWISRCDVLLAVIGRGWLTATDDEGARRLENPGDYVRLELEAALSREMRVVPVLVHGAQMPKRGELPESLVPLLDRNAWELTRLHWEFDVEKLIGALERLPAEDSRAAEQQRAEGTAAAARELPAQPPRQQAEDDPHAVGAVSPAADPEPGPQVGATTPATEPRAAAEASLPPAKTSEDGRAGRWFAGLSSNQRIALLVAVIGVIAAAIAVPLAVSGGGGNTYPASVRSNFLKSCEANTPASVNGAKVCGCVLTKIEDQEPLSQFVEDEQNYKRTGRLPSSYRSAVFSCLG